MFYWKKYFAVQSKYKFLNWFNQDEQAPQF